MAPCFKISNRVKSRTAPAYWAAGNFARSLPLGARKSLNRPFFNVPSVSFKVICGVQPARASVTCVTTPTERESLCTMISPRKPSPVAGFFDLPISVVCAMHRPPTTFKCCFPADSVGCQKPRMPINAATQNSAAEHGKAVRFKSTRRFFGLRRQAERDAAFPRANQATGTSTAADEYQSHGFLCVAPRPSLRLRVESPSKNKKTPRLPSAFLK